MTDQEFNPYVGPRTFEEKDGKIFFGRDREADDLLSMIISEPLVLYYAQSGAGKSSLLNARIIPGLREEGFAVLPTARVGGIIPPDIDDVANAFVFNLLLSLDHGNSDYQQLARTTLTDYLGSVRARLESDTDAPEDLAIVLLVDQFEEFITSNLSRWRDREGFFLQLRQAMADDPMLWIVLTLREDYVAALDPFARLMPDRMRARFYMKRMGAAAAQEAIEKPAAEHGRPFAEGVAEQLVQNLRQIRSQDRDAVLIGEYVEPVHLQVVCYQLWQNLRDRPFAEITTEDLQELGNVDVALSEFYEQAICAAVEQSDITEITVRNWFERQLITEAETRGTVYQGTENTAGLPNEIVKRLEDRFLLRAEIRAGGTWYELVHDRFVTPIMQSNQSWRLQQSPLVQAAEAWDLASRDRNLLYEGKQLEAVLTSVNRETAEPIVQAFLTASEEAQSQRNLEAVRAQAEEERQRAEAEARAARLLRVLAGALFVVFLIALAAAYSAVRQSRVADNNAQEAEAQAVVASEARATAEASAAEAESARRLAEENELEAQAARQAAEESAEEAIDARAEAVENEQAAIANAEEARVAQDLAEQNQLQAQEARDAAVASAAEAERLRQVAMAQSLAALAPRIIDLSNDSEFATLLALESLRLNQEVDGGLEGLIDSSLRQILSLPDFNTTLTEHQTVVRTVAVSPDGRILASSDDKGTVRLWDLTQPDTQSMILYSDAGTTRQMSFSQDGLKLAYVSNDFALALWDLAQPEFVLTMLEGHEAPLRYFAFSPNGQTIIVTTADNNVFRWNVSQTPPSVTRLINRGSGNPIIGLSPDGETLVTADANNTINFWDLTIPGAPRSTFLIGHADPVSAVAFTPDGRRFASGDEGGQIRVWDLTVATPFPVRLFPLETAIAKLVFSQDGQRLASFSTDASDLIVRLWNPAAPESPPVGLHGHGSTIEDIDLSQDGLILASASSDRTIRLWDLGIPVGLPKVLTGHEQGVYAVATSPDGEVIASGGADQLVRLWSGTGEAWETRVLAGHKGAITTLAFTPDGQVVASGSEDGTVRLWHREASTGSDAPASFATLSGHEEGVRSIAIDPAGRMLASASVDATVRLWDLTSLSTSEGSAAPLVVLSTEGDPVWSVAFSPDGETLATGHESSAILLWDIDQALSGETPVPRRRLVGSTNGVRVVAFSPDGQILASAGEDLNILLWSVVTPEEDPIRLAGHQDWVFSVAFSPDGTEIASASWDQTIRLWDLTGLPSAADFESEFAPDEPTTLVGHSSVVRSVAYTLNGKVLVSGSEDETIQIWEVDANTFRDLACQKVHRNMTWEEWERNLPGVEYRLTCSDLPLHPSFVQAAREAARDGNIVAAISRFERAVDLDPSLDIDPVAETAGALVEGGMEQAEEGDIEDALTFFGRARELSPDVAITARQWLTLCTSGAREGMFSEITPACENAVQIAVTAEDLALNRSICQVSSFAELASTVAPACGRAAELAASTGDALLNYQICLRRSIVGVGSAVDAACEAASDLIREITLDEPMTGSIAAGAAELWSFNGRAGQRISISMSDLNTGLDSRLALLGPDGRELASNDDSGDSEDSLIADFTLPETGTYLILAQGFRESAGSYQLTVNESS